MTMTPEEEQTANADLDALTRRLLNVIARADVDPLLKPFAALSAAGQVCAIAADSSASMRLKVAAALVSILRGIAREWVVDTSPSGSELQH